LKPVNRFSSLCAVAIISAFAIPSTANAECSYRDALDNDGWGWDQVSGVACQPLENSGFGIPVRISTDLPEYAFANNPRVSKDGRQIVYQVTQLPRDYATEVFLYDRNSDVNRLVSVDSAGEPINGHSPAISGDGRFIAFLSAENHYGPQTTPSPVLATHTIYLYNTSTEQSSALFEVDAETVFISNNGRYITYDQPKPYMTDQLGRQNSVFIHDRWGAVTEEIDLNFGIDVSSQQVMAVSGDGRYSFIGVYTWGDDTVTEVYIYDRELQTTTPFDYYLSPQRDLGKPISAISGSENGRYVAFNTDSDDIVSGDTNDAVDIFVRDQNTGDTTRVSLDQNGLQSNGISGRPRISADGRYVAFTSTADLDGQGNISSYASIAYVHDRDTGITTKVSTTQDGSAAKAGNPVVSGDGSVVVYLAPIEESSLTQINLVELTDISNECVDTDGDGWGWDGVKSCIVTPSVEIECIDTPPANDGWGWDGSRSCRLPVVDPVCIDSPPVNDGWGWNGVTSCRL